MDENRVRRTHALIISLSATLVGTGLVIGLLLGGWQGGLLGVIAATIPGVILIFLSPFIDRKSL